MTNPWECSFIEKRLHEKHICYSESFFFQKMSNAADIAEPNKSAHAIVISPIEETVANA